MTLTEALKIRQQNSKDAPLFSVRLACGFTPLHLQTFLSAYIHLAHSQQALPNRNVVVTPGIFGDLAGALESLGGDSPHCVAVTLEWSDLDPRLGYRGSGSWAPRASLDIVTEARRMLDRIAAAIEKIEVPVALSLPTLPLPPLFHTPGWQSGEPELALRRIVAEFAERIVQSPRVRIVSVLSLDEQSPAAARFDLKSDLTNSLPYMLPHADILASLLVRLLLPAPPKKGIITDLDDTLWNGIVGEVGPDGVSWDLASHHQLHGLYQKLLATLSEEGTLVAVASKNDAAVVAEALGRDDLLLRPQQIFPIEAHWSSKSGSIERILRTWNIGADSVVFIDDSPMELAEVAAVHPGIECIRFPTNDDREGYRMLWRLRNLFGKQNLSAEDSLRLESLRRGAEFQQGVASGVSPESFLEQAQAKVTFDFGAAGDPRVLELVNKTNQFNLNGIRYTEADWQSHLAAPGAFVVAISYEDKFGPLGKIAIMQGRAESSRLHLSTWVMSCRAFSRRIEFQCLKKLFERHGVDEIFFEFSSTPKNGPTRELFAKLLGNTPFSELSPVCLPADLFAERCPRLYHQVETISDVESRD